MQFFPNCYGVVRFTEQAEKGGVNR